MLNTNTLTLGKKLTQKLKKLGQRTVKDEKTVQKLKIDHKNEKRSHFLK